MLRINYLEKKIKEIKREIMFFSSKRKLYSTNQEEYVSHLKRLLSSYKVELEKAYERPVDVEDETNYIFNYFPRTGEGELI